MAKPQDITLDFARRQWAKLQKSRLQGADFDIARVGGITGIVNCEIDKKTNFTGVCIESIR